MIIDFLSSQLVKGVPDEETKNHFLMETKKLKSIFVNYFRENGDSLV